MVCAVVVRIEVWVAGSGGEFCPVEPERWLHRAAANPNTQKAHCMCILTLGGGVPAMKQMFLLPLPTSSL
eukprot:2364286-Ditylum_brightwellii.AAC.1